MLHRYFAPMSRPAAGGRRRKSAGFRPGMEGLEARLALSGASEAGMEIAYVGDLGTDYKGPTGVYLAGGANPISTEAWATYTPPPSYIKNTNRNVEFDSAVFLASPDSTTANTYITTSDGYTWQFVTETVSANYPFRPGDYPGQHYTSPYEAAALTPTPPAGVVRYSANTKNAVTTWLARDAEGQPIQRYFIRDAWNNVYIMQASGAAEEADVESNFFSAVLPPGWVKFTRHLPSDLVTGAAYDSQGVAQFNIFRDSADDSFQQITWSPRGVGIAQQIVDMPVWAGPTADRIVASPTRDSTIHGAQGNDVIRVSGRDAVIYGDAGTDVAVFPGRRRQYAATAPNGDGSTVVVRRAICRTRIQIVTLHDVEAISFADGMVSTSTLARRATLRAMPWRRC